MQLNKRNISTSLAMATASLLGVTAPTIAQAEQPEGEWQFDTALLYYGESDDRVQAVEGMVSGRKEVVEDKFLTLKMVVDVLTGASANGAVPQDQVQTFTRPSGKGQYDVQPGDTPLDDTFKDTRVQFNAQWEQPLTEDLNTSVGAHLSKEYDYLSLGVNGSLAKDFNQKNTTVSIGGSYFHDTIEPEGGLPVALSEMVVDQGQFPSDDAYWDAFYATRGSNDDTKQTYDLILGVTQVMNRQWLMQLNYGYSYVDGYQTDPFKVVSVIDPDGHAQAYRYESRPDTRSKHSLFWQNKYSLFGPVVDISYRYMWDDWEIDSHTVDAKIYYPLSNGHYIQPHLRYYTQSAADFYTPYLYDGQPLPNHASADYRVGELDTYTLGLKYGIPFDSGDELAFRLEYYHQVANSAGDDEPGILADQDLYPELDAIFAQITYSF